jgi:hypothetical protein
MYIHQKRSQCVVHPLDNSFIGGLAQWSCVWPRDLVHPASVRIRHPPPRELFGTIEVITCANAVVGTNQDANNWRMASPSATFNLVFTDAPGYSEILAIYAVALPERRLFKYSGV